MENSLCITAAVDHPGMLEILIEKLASRRNDNDSCKEKMPKGWQPFETSSTEVYLNGSVELFYSKDDYTRMPFTTSFLFTCMGTKKDSYKVNWGISLS